MVDSSKNLSAVRKSFLSIASLPRPMHASTNGARRPSAPSHTWKRREVRMSCASRKRPTALQVYAKRRMHASYFSAVARYFSISASRSAAGRFSFSASFPASSSVRKLPGSASSDLM